MKNQLMGVVAAAVAVFFWGFLYWGATTIPYGPLKATTGDEAAQKALLEHFPETGMYLIPGMRNDDATMSRLTEAGPIAMVNFVREGQAVMDPSLMIRGFLLNVLIVFLLSMLLKKALPALPTYGDRVMFAALAGLTAVVMVNLGDAVWWRHDLGWVLSQALYGLVASIIAGAVLGKFIRPEKAG